MDLSGISLIIRFKYKGCFMFYRALIIAAVLSLSGCAIVPDPIKVADDKALVGYSKAVVAGDGVIGQQARWGGIITSVENKDNKTTIEMVYFPLNHYAKPITTEQTPGRFKAVINNFVDPIMFAEGRLATFVGTVSQPLAGMVGEQPYMFPAILVEDYHLWRDQQLYNTNSVFFDFYGGWYSPFYPRYWGPWGLYHPGYRSGFSLYHYTQSRYHPARNGQDDGGKSKPAPRTYRGNNGEPSATLRVQPRESGNVVRPAKQQ